MYVTSPPRQGGVMQQQPVMTTTRVTSSSTSTLPPGWVSGFDEQHKRVFYFHKPTRRATWTKPQLEEAVAAAAVMGGSNGIRQNNMASPASSIMSGGGGGGGGRGAFSPVSHPPAQPPPTNSLQIQSEWMEVFSPEHNRVFYYNRVTRESVWVDPRIRTNGQQQQQQQQPTMERAPPQASSYARTTNATTSTSNGTYTPNTHVVAPRTTTSTGKLQSSSYRPIPTTTTAPNDYHSHHISLEEELQMFAHNLLGESEALTREAHRVQDMSGTFKAEVNAFSTSAQNLASSSSAAPSSGSKSSIFPSWRTSKNPADHTALMPWGDAPPKVLDVKRAMKKVQTGIDYARSEMKAHAAATKEAEVTEAEGGYYHMLGLPNTCSMDDIKKGYRRQMGRWHPDKLPPDEKGKAQDMAHLLNVAYSCLIDPWERYLYDWLGLKAYLHHRNTIKAFQTFMITGIPVTKHPRKGWMGFHNLKERHFWLSPDLVWLHTYKEHMLDPPQVGDEMEDQFVRKQWEELGGRLPDFKSVHVADVIEVTRGLSTDVFLKTGKRKNVSKYFSIVTNERTLDLETEETATADMMFSRLQLTIIDIQKNRNWARRYYDLKAQRDAAKLIRAGGGFSSGRPSAQPPPPPPPPPTQSQRSKMNEHPTDSDAEYASSPGSGGR